MLSPSGAAIAKVGHSRVELMELLAIRLVKLLAIPLSPKVRGKRLVISPQAGKSLMKQLAISLRQQAAK